MFIFFRKSRRPQGESYLAESRLQQINFVILVISVVGSTKVKARPALLGARSVSVAAKRTILQGNAPLSSTSNKVALLEEENDLPVFQVFKVSANHFEQSVYDSF